MAAQPADRSAAQPAARSTKQRRPRRSAAEVQPLILAAARDLFLAKGFHATTTRDIAARAGVAETMLFRYCGSKTRLFEDVVLEPFQAFLAEFVARWENRVTQVETTEDVIRSFTTGFYMLIRQHRELLLALAAAQVHPHDPLHDAASAVGTKLATLLGQLSTMTAAEGEIRHLPGIDNPALTNAVGIGMVMSLALLDDWLFIPGNAAPTASQVTHELATMMAHGMTSRP